MIELNDRAVRPKSLPDVFARDDFTWGFEEHPQDLEGLLLKSDPAPVLPQFSGAKVELKRAEAHSWPAARCARFRSELSVFHPASPQILDVGESYHIRRGVEPHRHKQLAINQLARD